MVHLFRARSDDQSQNEDETNLAIKNKILFCELPHKKHTLLFHGANKPHPKASL